jgi:hypothetical protein
MRLPPSSLGRLSTSAALILALLFALFALASPAFGAVKGIDTDLTWGTSGKTQVKTSDASSDLGVQWTRLAISWHDYEPTKGNYNSGLMSALDNAVSLSQARGIHVLINIVDSPEWASGSSIKETAPRNNADYTHVLSDSVTRYRGKAEAYEIWNEQNTNHFWSSGVNAGQYANLLKDSYAAVKAADPTAKVVFGGLARNDHQFVTDAYNAVPNLGSYYDVMATHPYPDWSLNGAPDQTLRNSDGRLGMQSFNGYREVRQVMLGHGDDKPIWFTEFGWSTWSGGVSPATQAAYTTLAMKCVEQDPYVQIAFLYNLRNNYWANNGDSWDDQLGIMNVDFSPKPAYTAYKAYTPGTTGCVYRESDGSPTTALRLAPRVSAASAIPAVPTTTSSSSPSTTSSQRTAPRRTRTVLRMAEPKSARSASAASNALRAASAAGETVRAASSVRFTVTMIGKVLGASRGRVTLQLQRNVRGHWRRVGARSTAVLRTGAFKRAMRSRGEGGFRVRALYSGARGFAPSKSNWVRFRIEAPRPRTPARD